MHRSEPTRFEVHLSSAQDQVRKQERFLKEAFYRSRGTRKGRAFEEPRSTDLENGD